MWDPVKTHPLNKASNGTPSETTLFRPTAAPYHAQMIGKMRHLAHRLGRPFRARLAIRLRYPGRCPG